MLKSAKLTGIWENKLRKIESREYDAAQFIDELKAQIGEIVYDVLSDNSGSKIAVPEEPRKEPAKKKAVRKPAVKSLDQVVCPLCGKGHIIKGKTAYGCSEYKSGCSFRLPFADVPEKATPAQVNKKIQSLYKKNTNE